MNFRLSRSQASVVATLVIALVLIISASLRYTGFFSLPVFINLFDDNAFLGIAAIGMTFVILSGGIDLSVGSMIGFTSIASALLVERAHMHPLAAAAIVLLASVVFGAIQGFLIAQFDIAPFLVTLAGMFFVRGAAFTLSLESIALTHPLFRTIQTARLPLGSTSVPPTAVFFFFIAIIGLFIATQTRFGRGLYAIGGNATSALLMGLPLKRILIGTYAFSAFCAALAGLTFAVYTSSGNATAATGLELDVIAAVVIGGTLLTGGQGSILGTVLGVLILGLIQTIINFDGTLNSWWTRIVIGVLLFFFVVLQKLLSHLWLLRSRSVRVSTSQVAAAAPIAVFVLAFAISSNVLACPPGWESGRRLDTGLIQLTGNGVKSWSLEPGDLPDPAPPYTGADGSVEIYGSSLSYAHYANRGDFENGGCFERVPLDLRQDNGVGYTFSPYSHPWDVRKFRVEQNGQAPYEILVAGAMSRSGSNNFPIWPDDNQSRRIFMFHRNAQGVWTRDANPIIGKVEPQWVGHSYGGNFIQVGMTDQNVLQPDRQGEIVFFYDMVSDGTGGAPYKTEMFESHVQSGGAPLTTAGPQIPVFQINNPPYPSLKRTIGGYLAEGPRPIEMNIQGQTFYIVAFSAGDFPTDFYTLNYAWSRSVKGPFKAVLSSDGSDLLDLGKSIKADYGLSWMGRPSFFRSPGGGYEAMFHAVRKDLYPGNDFTKWPTGSLNFYRSLFKVSLAVSLNAQNEPVITLDPHHAVSLKARLKLHY